MLESLKKVVFFAAHTDDEMICAGTLHRLARAGVEVQLVVAAYASTQGNLKGANIGENIDDEWIASMNRIGINLGKRMIMNFYHPQDFQPHRQTICQTVYNWCEREKPDAAFILSPEDENTAHAIMGVECERVMRGRVPITIRCQFPWNYGLGRPNLFVKLDDEDVECKRQVIRTYQSQKFRYDYEGLLMAQAKADGLSVKVPWAEKFELVRGVL